MMLEAIKKLVEKLDSEIKDQDLGNPFFSKPEYETFPLEEKHFKPITEVESTRKLAFVDGGNLEILGAPNFSVQVNRVYYNVFDGKVRLHPKTLPPRVEFFSVTFASFKGGEIYYDTSLFPVREEFSGHLPLESDLSFSSFDRTVMNGMLRADISRVASIARRFAEWEYAKSVINYELERGDVLVMDGTLQTAFTNESKYSSSAYKAAMKKGVIFTGLSKTSHLFTDTGLSLIGAVQKLSEDSNIPYKTWYYPIAEVMRHDHEASIYVVKLHSQAQRVFRYEIYKKQADKLNAKEIKETLARMALNSRDISFPGYPYGLIDADHRARVRVDEAEGYRVKLFSEISKKEGRWAKFARHVLAADAHSLLNVLAG